jgi:colanic acid/amylovoran biosynthesis protein
MSASLSRLPLAGVAAPESQELPPLSPAAAAPKQILLLGAGYSTRNMGVWALASGAIASALHSFPEAQVRLFDYAREGRIHTVKHPGGTARVELVNIRFSKNVVLKNNIARLLVTALVLRAIPSNSWREQILEKNPYLKTIAQADLIGSIAGGDSFSDIYGLGRLVYVSLPQVLVLLMRKSLVLLPQTLGPFNGVLARMIARYILRRAHVVYARDRESLKSVELLVGRNSSRLHLSYDMAFGLEPIPPSKSKLAHLRNIDACRPLVGLNVSGLLYMGGYTQDNMFDLKADYRDLIREIIRFFAQQHNAHVVLIPHVLGDASNSESDGTVSLEIHREMSQECRERLHLLEGEYDHQQIKYVIGQCDFFLGSRMHACIGALSQCVPALGLAYSRKFRGVFASINSEDLVIDLAIHEREEVMRRIEAAYQQREEVRKRLKKRVPEVKSAVLDLFSTLLPKNRSDQAVHFQEARR